MQHLNDDMDDLFRKAAEGYPLNTKGADWEKLQAMLSQEQTVVVEKKGKRKHFLWLLLLLPIVFICNRISNSGYNRQETVVAEQQKTPGGTSDTRVHEPVQLQKKTSEPAIGQNSTAATIIREAGAGTLPKEDGVFERLRPQERNAGAETKSKAIITSEAVQQGNAYANENATKRTYQQVINSSSFKNNFVELATIVPAAPVENKSIIERSSTEATTVTKPDSLNKKDGSAKARRFYAGVIAGPDLSTVKFKKFSEVGFQAGIILGYKLTDRLAVELGALSSKKYYYSDGENLNTKKLYLPPNSKVLSMDGNCRMIELPVAFQYSLATSKTHSWFASAGLSSYIMKKENYSYDYLYLNSGNVVTHEKSYVNQTRNWASVLQLSAGYRSRLGGAGDLRIEPYYSIPLKGIGYGELPLSSFGLRFGFISKRF